MLAFADDFALWFRLAHHVDNERHMQVVEIAFGGEEIRRQHIRSIRLDNVRHSEEDARRAEQNLLSAQENLRETIKFWSTMPSRNANEFVRRYETSVRRCEENARQAREVARRAVEALGIPGEAD